MASGSTEHKPAWTPDRIFGFADSQVQGKALADLLGASFEIVDVHYFPDSECRVQLRGHAHRPAIYRPLHIPNAKLIEVILAASVLRDDGAKDIGLIAPYLPYMRQDIAFRPGEAVSQRVIGKLLAAHFDRFVSVDPHLHRTPTLDGVFGGKPSLALTGAPAMVQHLRDRNVSDNVLILGPDEESEPIVKAVAAPLDLPWALAKKVRKGDRDVQIALPEDVPLNRRSVIIVDDVISSGTTVITLTRAVRDLGAKTVDVYTTHALYDDRTADSFSMAGIRRVVSCDGIPHRSNDMSVAKIIADGLLACP
ncbi:MAG: ribose-phosphate diphosphokinase [Rhodobacteraceae bacterium]|nr:ribose-phosphate diphosphokinase [Paracoccaceae bacterium]